MAALFQLRRQKAGPNGCWQDKLQKLPEFSTNFARRDFLDAGKMEDRVVPGKLKAYDLAALPTRWRHLTPRI
ncbi:MAG TPA: hypothetical protein VGC15_23225 [Acetobacteraceae bacterium]